MDSSLAKVKDGNGTVRILNNQKSCNNYLETSGPVHHLLPTFHPDVSLYSFTFMGG